MKQFFCWCCIIFSFIVIPYVRKCFRGGTYPEITSYILVNNCAKFGAFIHYVPVSSKFLLKPPDYLYHLIRGSPMSNYICLQRVDWKTFLLLGNSKVRPLFPTSGESGSKTLAQPISSIHMCIIKSISNCQVQITAQTAQSFPMKKLTCQFHIWTAISCDPH